MINIKKLFKTPQNAIRTVGAANVLSLKELNILSVPDNICFSN